MEQLLTAKEIATILGVTVQTVYTWMEDKGLPSVVIGENSRRFRPSDVDEWVKGQPNNK